MYYYSIENYQYSIELIHKEHFNQKEFENMCRESPMSKFGYYTMSKIKKHLIDNYGFEEIGDKVTARFNVDDEEDETFICDCCGETFKMKDRNIRFGKEVCPICCM